MLRHAVERPAVPPVRVIACRLVCERAFSDTPRLIGDEEIRMHLQVSAESGAGDACTGWFVEGEVMRSEFAHQHAVFGASEVF